MALWGRKSKSIAERGEAHETPRSVKVPTVEAVRPPGTSIPPAVSPEQSAPPSLSSPREPSPAAPPLGEQVLKRRAVEAKQLLLGFGEVVSVLLKSPQFRSLTLAQVEELVVPAIAARQFIVAEAQSRTNGLMSPVAAALWALVSKEIDERLTNDVGKPLRLAPSEWRSGDIPWLIVVAGDRRIIQPMLQNLQANQLKGRALKTRVRGSGGAVEAGTVTFPEGDRPRVNVPSAGSAGSDAIFS